MKNSINWLITIVVIIFFVYQWNDINNAMNQLDASVDQFKTEYNALVTSYNNVVEQNEQWKTAYDAVKSQNDYYRRVLIETYGWTP